MADMTPTIISSYDPGLNNADLDKTISRLSKEGAYKDLRTIIIIPALLKVDTKAVASWWSMITPPNQGVVRLFAVGMEVGAAYSATIESILNHPDLKNWKYVMSIEADNIVPPDGMLKLLERMEEHPEYAGIGGLYFTKGCGGMGQPSGVAQIWGLPDGPHNDFRPQVPKPDSLMPCRGTGMGFNMWRLDMFKDERLRRPWFKTVASAQEGVGTQDLYFAADANKHGYRFAVDTSIRVGHVDGVGQVW